MHIWVDADACPVVIRQILFRAARRTGVPITLVDGQTVTLLDSHELFARYGEAPELLEALPYCRSRFSLPDERQRVCPSRK